MKGYLILENNVVLEGKLFGYTQETVGEVVFNTGMTGYQEVLTDPSYYGQIVTMTYPLIGNYGINIDDYESKSPKVRGFIVREKCDMPSNFRCEFNLDDYLKQNKIVAIEGIDTRYLTKMIRNQGTLRGIITNRKLNDEQLQNTINSFSNVDAVEKVTTKEVVDHCEGEGLNIAAIDFGIKANIIRSFKKRGCNITVYPAFVGAKEILEKNYDGVFLSNGPGDPKDLVSVIEEIKKMMGKIPITGICLGHQLLALALGGDTQKLKFGHRGCNHPVKDLQTGKVIITSQNHGYVVEEETLPENVKITHVNMNDETVEGMRIDDMDIYSIQFHPEACPGPYDAAPIFDEFIDVYMKAKIMSV